MTIISLFFSSDLQPLIWDALKYPGPPAKEERPPTRARLEAEARLLQGLLDMRALADTNRSPAHLVAALKQAGVSASAKPDGSADAGKLTVTCDVVIVGSGAGGGAAASILAKAGLKVLVVEKGHFTPAAELTLNEGEAYSTMYEGAGAMKSDNTCLTILAGATVGGGTRVNWGISFETPAKVREQWAKQHGIPWYLTAEYTEALADTCSRYNVTINEIDSRQNQLLKQGLDALGMHSARTPRNINDPQDRCGFTTFGCARGNKQDTSGTWLPDAVDAGAKLMSGIKATQINTEPCRGHAGLAERKAVGISVEIEQADGTVRAMDIRAPAVICAGNAIATPALMLASGIEGRGQVGAHLQCHPITQVRGVFPAEMGPVEPWNGSVTTWFNRDIGDWNSNGYGAWLHASNAHIGYFSAGSGWSSGADFKQQLLDFSQTCCVAVFVRDSSEGRLYLNEDGMPCISYQYNEYDRRTMIQAAGARRVLMSHPDLFWDRPDAAAQAGMSQQQLDAGFQDFLDRIDATISHPDFVDATLPCASAHQMGTARMGADPASSVCDQNGESWDVSGLFVCDGAALPTSIGANPMITISATAVMIAKRLSHALCS
ncbi:hypothetical protein WJX74_009498 [Apatococcus lobatus]|uniref:Long-chain-alcohol oxidase n=1 Tax=Apatococcus lobatus TaxID=904363 RepID=A0AAW1RJM2_9CHLO